MIVGTYDLVCRAAVLVIYMILNFSKSGNLNSEEILKFRLTFMKLSFRESIMRIETTVKYKKKKNSFASVFTHVSTRKMIKIK